LLLSECLEEFLLECRIRNYTDGTIGAYRIALNAIFVYFDKTFEIDDIEKVKKNHIKSFIVWQLDKGIKVSTINTKLKRLKPFFNYCFEEEYIKQNIMDEIHFLKNTKNKFTVFNDDEVRAMLKAWKGNSYTATKNRTILAMLVDTGIRTIELLNLKIENVDKYSLKVLGKGNKWRTVPISPRLQKEMMKYERVRKKVLEKKGKECEYYFMNCHAQKISNNSPVQKMIKLTAKKANVREIVRASPHTFRHYYAIKSLELGTPIYQLSKNLGHSSIKTTEIYLSQITNEQLEKEATEKTKSPLSNLF